MSTTQTTEAKTLSQIQDVAARRQDLLKLDAAIHALHPAARQRLGLTQPRVAVRVEIENLGAEINAYLEVAGVDGRKAAKAVGVWYV
jgi:hypothetical protein